MAVICCDTSFLFSIYSPDASSENAIAIAARLTQPVAISLFAEFEFENAVRLSVFRRAIDSMTGSAMLANYASDKEVGKIELAAFDLEEVLTQAKALSAAYSQAGGYRPFDIIHVAAAMRMGATEFISFDANQRKLAKAVGLRVRPV